MPDFPHLPLTQKITARHKFRGVPIEQEISEITREHLVNRAAHGNALKDSLSRLSGDWEKKMLNREALDLPELPHEDIVPIFLKVDSNLFDTDSLFTLGIDVIAEDEDGFIIGAGGDNFKSLKEKIESFLAEKGQSKNQAAKLWEIIIGDRWRLDYILSPELSRKWDQMSDADTFVVDVSIACYEKISDTPALLKNETEEHYRIKYEKWKQRKEYAERRREALEMQRQDELGQFISELEGVIISDFVGYADSFCCRIELSGRALKDFVLNYQYVFDVTEYETFQYTDVSTGEEEQLNAIIVPPSPESPVICIIDSGIQEEHRLLRPALDFFSSYSFIPADNSTMDEVSNGGHGTKVAGAALYGNTIPKTGTYELDIQLRNARVLNEQNQLPISLFPPKLMSDVVSWFNNCKIYNLSVTANRACRQVHMSKWATSIDQIMYRQNKLFVIASGNISIQSGNVRNPGIKEHISAGRNYPDYLYEQSARIADPAQSCFALIVGSVCLGEHEDDDRISFGKKDDPSSFTRRGPGMWRMIKPDVVEYGGDYICEKGTNPNISQLPTTCVEVVQTTTGGNNAVGFAIGSSFAAPKVSHIAAKVLKNIPEASANLLRALVIQSARLPNEKFRAPQLNDISVYGYGIPDVKRASENTASRITLVTEERISPGEARIYTVKVPDEIRRPGNEYDILVEVTLTFMAEPRRTRRKLGGYLSSWVDWQSSYLNESYDHFKSRVTKYVDNGEQELTEEQGSDGPIQWRIRENINWGTVKGLRRQDSSAQKDWTVLKAYNLPEEFSIAAVGHKGWEKDITKDVPFALAVSFEVLGSEVDIYNLIRIENDIEISVTV